MRIASGGKVFILEFQDMQRQASAAQLQLCARLMKAIWLRPPPPAKLRPHPALPSGLPTAAVTFEQGEDGTSAREVASLSQTFIVQILAKKPEVKRAYEQFVLKDRAMTDLKFWSEYISASRSREQEERLRDADDPLRLSARQRRDAESNPRSFFDAVKEGKIGADLQLSKEEMRARAAGISGSLDLGSTLADVHLRTRPESIAGYGTGAAGRIYHPDDSAGQGAAAAQSVRRRTRRADRIMDSVNAYAQVVMDRSMGAQRASTRSVFAETGAGAMAAPVGRVELDEEAAETLPELANPDGDLAGVTVAGRGSQHRAGSVAVAEELRVRREAFGVGASGSGRGVKDEVAMDEAAPVTAQAWAQAWAAVRAEPGAGRDAAYVARAAGMVMKVTDGATMLRSRLPRRAPDHFPEDVPAEYEAWLKGHNAAVCERLTRFWSELRLRHATAVGRVEIAKACAELVESAKPLRELQARFAAPQFAAVAASMSPFVSQLSDQIEKALATAEAVVGFKRSA